MEPACVRHTELPHTTRLFADFTYHFDKVHSFYEHRPGQPQSYAAAAAEIDYPDERRAALVAALRGQNGGSAALDLLAQPGTVAVVTGQQVGLFSGPAYTIYKALTAAKLAHQLNAQGIAAVPVFWLATEDHDLAEVDHCWVFDEAHRPVQLKMSGPAGSRSPVGSITPDSVPAAGLREALHGFPSGDEVATLVETAYAPGRTLGQGFRELLRQLLAPYGVLFLDPLDPAIRSIAAPLLRRSVESAHDLKDLLLERDKALSADGYHAQVHVEKEIALFFLLEGADRIALRRQNGDYTSRDRRYSQQALMDVAERVSPNALLRPVMQDYILPTVAYVGGPAELAYMAQAQVIYKHLLGRMPVVLARNGFTLLDAKGSKLFERYGLRLPDVLEGEEALREKISWKLTPPSLLAEFEKANADAVHVLDRLGAELTAFDPTLAAALDKSRAKILFQLSKIESKTARETLRRDQRVSEDVTFLLNLVYPGRHLQERVYSILPFLAKHGLDLIGQLYDNLHLDCPDHLVLTV